ncbi:MAG: ferredoxin [Puniceicoccales bacterium]|nr:ferredoxin [Puniceicoccales bacterium]
MTITKVWLDESQNECISCGACESVAPDIFEVPQKMAVREGADFSNEDAIHDAANSCPVSVIAFEVDGSGQRDNN